MSGTEADSLSWRSRFGSRYVQVPMSRSRAGDCRFPTLMAPTTTQQKDRGAVTSCRSTLEAHATPASTAYAEPAIRGDTASAEQGCSPTVWPKDDIVAQCVDGLAQELDDLDHKVIVVDASSRAVVVGPQPGAGEVRQTLDNRRRVEDTMSVHNGVSESGGEEGATDHQPNQDVPEHESNHALSLGVVLITPLAPRS